MSSIKFEELSLEMRSKIFQDVRKFHLDSMKEIIELIERVDPNQDLKISSLEDQLRKN